MRKYALMNELLEMTHHDDFGDYDRDELRKDVSEESEEVDSLEANLTVNGHDVQIVYSGDRKIMLKTHAATFDSPEDSEVVSYGEVTIRFINDLVVDGVKIYDDVVDQPWINGKTTTDLERNPKMFGETLYKEVMEYNDEMDEMGQIRNTFTLEFATEIIIRFVEHLREGEA